MKLQDIFENFKVLLENNEKSHFISRLSVGMNYVKLYFNTNDYEINFRSIYDIFRKNRKSFEGHDNILIEAENNIHHITIEAEKEIQELSNAFSNLIKAKLLKLQHDIDTVYDNLEKNINSDSVN